MAAKEYSCKIELKLLSDRVAESDRQRFDLAERIWNDRDTRYFNFTAKIGDGDRRPRTKVLLAEFLRQKSFANDRHFLFQVKNVRLVKPKVDRPKVKKPSDAVVLIERRQRRLNKLREEAGLPTVHWPECDTVLDKKLHDEHTKCPFCGSDELDQGDYDGDKELTCKVECSGCGKEWWEKYRFIGAWQDDDTPGLKKCTGDCKSLVDERSFCGECGYCTACCVCV